MPGVLGEVDQGSSLTGWHFSRDLNEVQERDLHLRGCSGQKEQQAHFPRQEGLHPGPGTAWRPALPGQRGREEYGRK